MGDFAERDLSTGESVGLTYTPSQLDRAASERTRHTSRIERWLAKLWSDKRCPECGATMSRHPPRENDCAFYKWFMEYNKVAMLTDPTPREMAEEAMPTDPTPREMAEEAMRLYYSGQEYFVARRLLALEQALDWYAVCPAYTQTAATIRAKADEIEAAE